MVIDAEKSHTICKLGGDRVSSIDHSKSEGVRSRKAGDITLSCSILIKHGSAQNRRSRKTDLEHKPHLLVEAFHCFHYFSLKIKVFFLLHSLFFENFICAQICSDLIHLSVLCPKISPTHSHHFSLPTSSDLLFLNPSNSSSSMLSEISKDRCDTDVPVRMGYSYNLLLSAC